MVEPCLLISGMVQEDEDPADLKHRVLLGSFSNYLVTKSSVPVMVVRKRLRKHTRARKSSAMGRFDGNHLRQPNNLTSMPSSSSFNTGLARAKID